VSFQRVLRATFPLNHWAMPYLFKLCPVPQIPYRSATPDGMGR